jgi:1-deoxy-D-xylulose-5-phosphate synthase
MPPHKLPIGRGELLREGTDVTIVSIGTMALVAEHAADLLAQEGISAAIINARFVKPLDEKLLLDWARRTGAVVTLEEGVIAGGFGSAVLELLAREGLQLPVKVLGIPDRFFDHASQSSLRKQAGLSIQVVVEAGRSVTRQPAAATIG